MTLWLAILAGFVLLSAGGEFLVRGTVGIARRAGVSPLLAGLVIVGFGTSAPELVTGLSAAFKGAPDIAVGNVIGSNIANILLILGVSAIIINIPIDRRAFFRDGFFMSVGALVVMAGVLLGGFDRLSGILLFVLLIVYMIGAWYTDTRSPDAEAKRHESAETQKPDAKRAIPFLVLETVGGIAAVIYGADLLVGGAIELARGWGVSEAVIGLTIVAVGTSLPELVACAAAALKKQPDIALGNVVGSCIYNIFGILGLTAWVYPLGIAPQIANFDIWVLVGTTAFLMAFLRTGWTIHRHEGIALVFGYCAYIAVLVFQSI
ncbi:calcium/sodium antiporter [Sphingomicrobium sediminis]|uniref:Calcium/sodium antiporter n=1 Tax=Sphingomicrobium sediminis TaxID=2950949 RepID=A0A9X2EDX0_9SPHN|nr:calcium/sodium antiporter [Sphingomicrobium sediminis]MCM8556228.1 calcium/sodium antiporter [Sphingomicrobium sediminis]